MNMEKTWEELPRKATPALKKRIVGEWGVFFPELVPSSKVGFSRLVGPLKVGVALQFSSDGESYVPTFSVHNLSRDIDFLTSTLDHRLATARTGADDWLSVRWHDKNYREAAERMRSQCILPTEGPISLDQVIGAYKLYVEKNPRPHIISHVQDPAMIAAWAGESEKARQSLEWGVETFKSWTDAFQQGQGGLDVWRARVEGWISDPEKLRQTVRDQIVLHKLTKIPFQNFTDTTYQEPVA